MFVCVGIHNFFSSHFIGKLYKYENKAEFELYIKVNQPGANYIVVERLQGYLHEKLTKLKHIIK